MSTSKTEQAVALLQQGQASAAADLFKQILQGTPDDALAQAGLGHCFIRLGREEEAWSSVNTACRLSDRIPQAFSDLAWLALKRNDAHLAQSSAERALTLNPADANSHFILAQLLFQKSRFDEAEQAFERAARLHPSYVDARFSLGNQAVTQGDLSAASRHFGAYVQKRPDEVKGWGNYGLSLAHSGHPEARTALEKAVALAPGQVKPLVALAAVLQQIGASDAELIPVLQRIVALSPTAADMHLRLACSLFNEYRYDEARRSLQCSLELDPNNLTARWLDFQMPDTVVAANNAARDAFLARWRQGIEQFEAIDWSDPRFSAQAGEALTSMTNFHLAYLGKPLVQEYILNGRVLRQLAHAANPACSEVAVRPIGNKRRKIAVFSASLNAHSASLVWSSALLALDPAEFELGAFYPGIVEDVSTARWRGRAARFESGTRSIEAWIDALRAFAPDVVIFLDIGMNRLVQAVASLRHAPVQVTTWAHPVTSGMPTIDYFLSADACETDDAADHYSEKLIRLPRLGAYLDLPEPVAAPDKSADAGRPIRFLCAQSADKLHPGHDALFARILKANPTVQLDILCSMPANVIEALASRMRPEFARHVVDFDARCRIHPRQPAVDYHRFLAQADVCLDSLDFSGCVTSLDALWRDRPIVALPSRLMRGRQTYGMLRLLELDELIAADTDDYVRIATRLAQDGAWRNTLSQRIRSRKTELYRDNSTVTALAQFVRSVEPPVEDKKRHWISRPGYRQHQ